MRRVGLWRVGLRKVGLGRPSQHGFPLKTVIINRISRSFL